MKDKIIIPIHSILDVITNSSSELFIIDGTKGIETVDYAVKKCFEKYGPEYEGYTPSVYVGDPTYYDEPGFWNMNQYKDEDIIKYMEMRGYKIERPKEVTEPQAIIVEWERGTMDQRFIEEIAELFEVEVISN